MKQTNQMPPNVWPLLAAPLFLLLSACDRQDELAKLRAENEALKNEQSVSSNKDPHDPEARRAILTSLRKMSAAVNAGTNYRSYGDLLIQAVVEIEPRLPEMSDGAFKENAAASLLAFKDAKDFWSKFVGSSAGDAGFTNAEKKQYQQYKLHWLNQNEERTPSGNYVNEPAFKANISIIWEEADRRMKLAESAAK